MRPVFLRIEPTFESSFLGSGLGAAVFAGLTGAFLTGGSLVGAGLGCSGVGTWMASDGCACGVGFTSETGFDVLAALTGGISMTGFRCVET